MDTLVLNQPDEHRNIALIVVMDTFTRWIELCPITDYTAETAAIKVLEHFGRYGPPDGDRDNGSRSEVRK